MSWTDFSSLLAAAAILVSAGWAAWTYKTTAWIEARKPFLQKQFDFCIEATQAASQIATTDDADTFNRARVTFWELYWGRLGIVEDRELEVAMVEYGKVLPRFEVSGDRSELKMLSLGIARASRNLIQKGWKVGLGPLSGDRGGT